MRNKDAGSIPEELWCTRLEEKEVYMRSCPLRSTRFVIRARM
jgi:hypothetical protein